MAKGKRNYFLMAIVSISTSAPKGKVATCIADRAGGCFGKNPLYRRSSG